jgi:hypothetical protein
MAAVLFFTNVARLAGSGTATVFKDGGNTASVSTSACALFSTADIPKTIHTLSQYMG